MKRFSSILPYLVPAVFWLIACESEPPVYVTSSALNLRAGASTKGDLISRLERGQELSVLARRDKWVQVRTSEGVDGWVHGDYVGSAEDARGAYRADLKRSTRSTQTRSSPQSGGGTLLRDPTRLNLSADALLRGVEPKMELLELESYDGRPRFRGVSEDDHLVVEFQGDLDNVNRALMLVSVEDLSDEALWRNSAAALRFVKNAIPNWKRNTDWLAGRLRAMSEVDVGRGEIPAGRLRVTLDFVKPLGVVRFTIEPVK